MSPSSLERLADEWLRTLRRRGFSPNTERAYDWALLNLRRFLVREYEIEDCHLIRRWQIEAWQDSQLERGISARARSLAATAVRKWLQWMSLNGHPVDPNLWMAVSRVRVPRPLPRPLADDDLKRLLRFLSNSWPPGPNIVRLRDRALILYFLSTGARISEVLQVSRDEVERAIVWRKGRREGPLFPTPIAVEALEDYLRARKDELPDLWVGFRHGRAAGRLSPEGVRDICRRLAKQAGIPAFTPHQLRHSAGTIAYERTGSELATADFLDHSDLQTIRNYAKVSPRRRQEVMEALDGILRELSGPTDPRRPQPKSAAKRLP